MKNAYELKSLFEKYKIKQEIKTLDPVFKFWIQRTGRTSCNKPNLISGCITGRVYSNKSNIKEIDRL